MSPRRLLDHTGQAVALGSQLGGGGEGAVFEIPSSADRVAKLYHKPVPLQRAEKLSRMVGLARADLLKFAAWPTATLHKGPGGPVVGFLMPKVVGYREVHALYGPAHRKQFFPQADWAFLIHTALNCAVAFETVHGAGHVIGDVNQKNVLVSPRAMVSLIDCDSFQVRSNGQLFLCEVGVPEYTPPELQGKNFRGVERTANHDCFGLAVLVFHLLFMGRHPFIGRFLGKGDTPAVDQAIREFRFAYSRVAATNQMAPPPHALPLSVVSPELARLFERAFSHVAARPNGRPSAGEWSQELARFEAGLKKCPADPGHRVPSHLPACPWCGLIQAGGPNYFVTVAAFTVQPAVPGGVFVLATVWRQIEQVAAPRCHYQRPSLPAGVRVVPTIGPSHLPARPPAFIPSALPVRVRLPRLAQQRAVGWVAAGGVAILVLGGLAAEKPMVVFALLVSAIFGLWWAFLEWVRLAQQGRENAEVDRLSRAERRAIALHKEEMARWRRVMEKEEARHQQALKSARGALSRAEQHWQQEAARYQKTFQDLRTNLEAMKKRYESLAKEYGEERRQLEQNARAFQMQQYLQGKFISDHPIPDIGPVRKAALQSYGIETAFDIEARKVDQVPGFGPKLTRRLLEWRAEMDRGFRFDPTAGVPPALVKALDAKYGQRRQELEAQLQKGPEALRVQSAQAENHLSQLLVGIQRFLVQVAQAEADLAEVVRQL